MCLGSSFQRLAGFDCTTGGLLKIGLKPRVLACCDLRIYPRVLITPVRGSNCVLGGRGLQALPVLIAPVRGSNVMVMRRPPVVQRVLIAPVRGSNEYTAGPARRIHEQLEAFVRPQGPTSTTGR